MKTKGRPVGRLDTRMMECYPTKELRAKHRAYLVHQAQARFRGEDHELTEQEYFDLWRDYWPERGRRADQYTLTRCDPELPWRRDNVEIVTRKEQLTRNLGFSKTWRIHRCGS